MVAAVAAPTGELSRSMPCPPHSPLHARARAFDCPVSRSSQVLSSARAASRVFDSVNRRRARQIACTRAAVTLSIASHSAASLAAGTVLSFSAPGGLSLDHPAFRRRFLHRLRHERAQPVSREFCPRGLSPSDPSVAIRAVSASSGISVAALSSAVSSALSWRQPAPYSGPLCGSVPISTSLSVIGINALGADAATTALLCSVATRGASSMSAIPKTAAWRDNHASAYTNSVAVDALIAERVALGWMVDVTALYSAMPNLPVAVSPIGVVPKPNGKLRLIFDGSCGVADCVNDFANPAVICSPQLATFDQIVDSISDLRVKHPGIPILLYSTDLDSAYMRVPIRADDWWHLAQSWRGRVYWNLSAAFGLRPSGHWLYRFTSAMDARILALSGTRPHTYVDDSLGVALAYDMPACQLAMDSVPPSVGFPISSKNGYVPPGTSRLFLGCTFDTAAMTVTLSPKRLELYRRLVDSHARRRRILASDLASLIGCLQSAARVVRRSRPYLDSLHRAAASTDGRWVTLPQDARDDLAYWSDLLHDFNGVRIISHGPPAATVFSDACTSWGWGWVCHDLRLYGYGTWSDDPLLADAHINVLELVTGIAAAVATAAFLPADSSVALHMDNTTAVSSVAACRGSSPLLSNATRALAHILDTRPFSLLPSHIQGIKNVEADALSRGRPPSSVSSYRRVVLPPLWLTSIASSRRTSLVTVTPLGLATPQVAPAFTACATPTR